MGAFILNPGELWAAVGTVAPGEGGSCGRQSPSLFFLRQRAAVGHKNKLGPDRPHLCPVPNLEEKKQKLKTCYRTGFAILFYFSIVLGIKQGSAFVKRRKKKHLEIKLCVSLSAHFTHGRSAERNFRMFAFVVVDRVLGLFFVRNRSSELSVIMSLG